VVSMAKFTSNRWIELRSSFSVMVLPLFTGKCLIARLAAGY
jgi:hypothetical protein